MKNSLDDVPEYRPGSRNAWRNWLIKNHEEKERIWVVLRKTTSKKAGIIYEEAVQEALCFGWIDSVTRKKDDENYVQLFSRRKSSSVWSASNKKRLAALQEQDLVMPAGFKAIEIAKENGSWSRIDQSEAWEMPEDLKKALEKNKKAAGHFNAFPPSVQKFIFQWILMAKRPETREKRIIDTVIKAEKNIRANYPG